jgi:hypothetical protein
MSRIEANAQDIKDSADHYKDLIRQLGNGEFDPPFPPANAEAFVPFADRCIASLRALAALLSEAPDNAAERPGNTFDDPSMRPAGTMRITTEI